MHRDRDPYAPPPRHKDRSGAVVRFLIIAALIGAAAWGYMEYSQSPQTALTEPAEEQTMADSSMDQSYPAPPAQPQAAAPAQTPQSAPATPAPRSEPAESLPPPTTTTEPPAE